MSTTSAGRWLSFVGPGLIVAATGVGAGDLATGAIVGSKLGVAVLWAVAVGAAIKFVLNEGLARWQLATGETVLEGVVHQFGRTASILFLAYLVAWTYFTASALMSASGIALHALYPWGTPASDKVTYGIAQSLLAVLLVELGGYRLFERLMRLSIAVMFVTVIYTAVAVSPDWSAIAAGLLRPSIPDADGQGLYRTIALLGGVGGTLTILCYGYWIREEGRVGVEELRTCRIDLAVAYLFTGLFGMAMVIIGSRISVDKESSAALLVQLADELETQLGPGLRWMFLIGAWGAIFSSLLGVWQSVPYLFADALRLSRRNDSGEGLARDPISTRSAPYRGYLYAIATIPILGMFRSFETIQLAYSVFGALFIPLLALALLLLNGSSRRIPESCRNGWLSTLALLCALGVFAVYGYYVGSG